MYKTTLFIFAIVGIAFVAAGFREKHVIPSFEPQELRNWRNQEVPVNTVVDTATFDRHQHFQRNGGGLVKLGMVGHALSDGTILEGNLEVWRTPILRYANYRPPRNPQQGDGTVEVKEGHLYIGYKGNGLPFHMYGEHRPTIYVPPPPKGKGRKHA